MELFEGPREAWTDDGYLKDQDVLTEFSYRTVSADNNCCGPVAVFNLLRQEGRDVRFTEVLSEMDALHTRRIPGPTLMQVMRKYLRARLPGWREIHGRAQAIGAAEGCRMGILRYYEGIIPHFIAFFRVDGGAFRFLNVSEEVEDECMSFAEFADGHLRGGTVKLFYWQ